MRWRSGWRTILSAIAAAAVSSRHGATTSNARPAGRRGCASRAHQLQQWYRTLDQLLACKAQVEHALFLRLRDLFSLQVDMVFCKRSSVPTLSPTG